MRINARLRAAFIEGVETDNHRRLGRGPTREEGAAVLTAPPRESVAGAQTGPTSGGWQIVLASGRGDCCEPTDRRPGSAP